MQLYCGCPWPIRVNTWTSSPPRCNASANSVTCAASPPTGMECIDSQDSRATRMPIKCSLCRLRANVDALVNVLDDAVDLAVLRDGDLDHAGAARRRIKDPDCGCFALAEQDIDRRLERRGLKRPMIVFAVHGTWPAEGL